MQRVFDIVFSGLALIVLSPLLIPVVIVLRFTGEGEILFLQERVGRGGKPFKLYKFATMLKNSPNMGPGTVTMKDDPRILPVGKFLRKAKINELPQLLNILFGDMSVIGPRPLTRQTFSSYSFETQEILKRVRPGLSGVGSIVFRGEEDILVGEAGSLDFYSRVIAPYKGVIEEWYVQHQGLGTYFLAISLTVWVVLFPKSTLPWLVFRWLPEPPDDLKLALNWRG
jgi:lipopolysaccharide/colanic/teichoic acid biosynthesis glycosyltransferase